MAGIMMEGDYGQEVKTQGVPRIGGDVAQKDSPSGGSTTPVVASAHLSNEFRADGVAYPENPGVAVTTKPYPEGTRMTDSTPGDDIN